MKPRVILPTMYAGCFLASLAWMFMDSGDAWCGFYAVSLTMPWMGLAGAISDAVSPGAMQGTRLWHFSLVLSALLNASCLLLFGIAIELLWARVRSLSNKSLE